MALALCWHHNSRLKRVRNERLKKLTDYLRTQCNKLGTDFGKEKGLGYDKQEITVFLIVIWLSVLPVLVLAIIG
jgi:hypothetical protein